MAIIHNISNCENAVLEPSSVAYRFIASLAQVIANVILARALQALFRFERCGRLHELS